MKTTGYTTQPRAWNRLTAFLTVLIFSWSLCIPPVVAETIQLEGGSVDVSTQDNTTNWNVTGNPVWNVPEFNVPTGSIYNIAGLGSGASLALLVNGGQASNIFGTMNLTNLAFILQNIAGINIGATGIVNLNNASLIASTLPLNLNATDFLKQNYLFNGQGGFLTNDGKIIGNNADLVALVANAIENKGTIEVPMGTVALAAGNTVAIGISPDGMVSIGVDEATANTLGLEDQIKNTGIIAADGGKVILNAKAIDGLFDKAINLSAEPNAVSVVKSDDGVIEFIANGDIHNQGTLQAERGSITIAAGTGEVINEGILKAETLHENGYTFRSSGYLGATDAHFNNLDGYSFLHGTIAAGTYSDESYRFDGATIFEGAVTLNATGDIDISDNFTITLGGDTVFNADSDADGSGAIYLYSANIIGSGYDLTIRGSSDDMSIGAISGVDTLTLGANSSAVNLPYFYSTGVDDIDVVTLRTENGVKLDKNVIDDDGYHLIYSVSDAPGGLQYVGHNSTTLGYSYKMANNIDASDTVNWNYNEDTDSYLGFNPVGTFRGVFDGNSHTILNLTINRPFTGRVGLFGSTEGSEIQNVGLQNVNITGYQSVGGLVGFHDNESLITNSYATGSVTGYSYWVGLLVGANPNSSIYDSHSEGIVTGPDTVGGLVGTNLNGGRIVNSYSDADIVGNSIAGGLIGSDNGDSLIQNSHATGSVSGSWHVGGLAGHLGGASTQVSDSYATGSVIGIDESDGIGGLVGWNAAAISDSYSTGSVSGTWNVGALIGYNEGGTIINSYYNIDTASVNGEHALGVGGLYADQYADWLANGNSLDINDYYENDGTHYLINDLEDLKNFLGFSGAAESFKLTNSIDLTDAPGFYIPHLSVTEFDGNGYAVAHLSLDLATTSNVGLFGDVVGSTIKDISVTEINVIGRANVGGLVGTTYGGFITGTHVTGVVNGSSDSVGGLVGFNSANITESYTDAEVNGNWATGGLVGQNGGVITNSYSTGNVTSLSDAVGGLVGMNYADISNSHAVGNVTGSGTNFGGLVGENYASITDSYASGAVTGSSNVGGLAGYSEGSITGSYAMGEVTSEGGSFTGGLVGANASTIINSYAFGNVIGGQTVGGLVGVNSGSVSQSFATGTVTGIYEAGGLVGYNDGTIANSYATGDVYGNSAGGLVGMHDGGSISSSYATGNAYGDFAGGLVGYSNGGSISNSFAVGNAEGETAGGLVGEYGGGEILNSYFTNIANDNDVGEPEEGGLSAFYSTSHPVYWEDGIVGETAAWNFEEGAGDWNAFSTNLPHLDFEWSTNITTLLQLQNMNLDLSANYTLANDIDASPTLTWNPFSSYFHGFEPIGSEETPFTGSFDGMGYEISSLYINRLGDVGLFGYTNEGTLKNVTLSEFLIRSRPSAGSLGVLAGHIVDTAVENVIVNQSQISISSPAPRLGGDTYLIVDLASGIPLPDEDLNLDEVHGEGLLVGKASGGSVISGSSSSGTINRNWDVVGGLVGFLADSTITDSSSAANVAGRAFVGGLVGISWDSIIENGSYATGTVAGVQAIGGLVGAVLGGTSRLSDVYATGDVTSHDITSVFMGGPAASFLTGGLVGYSKGTDAEHRVVIQDSYATGNVTATTGISVGGLAGGIYYTEISDSYAEGNVEGYHSVGGFVGRTDLDSLISGSALTETTKASGTVTGVDKSEEEKSEAIGGFVGWHTNSTIQFSHATGDVTGYNGVGGFTGMNNQGSVYDSSALEGYVDGTIGVGGFIGVNNGGTYARNIWDETVNAHLLPIGGSVTGQSGSVYTYTTAVDRTLSEWNQWTGQYFEPPEFEPNQDFESDIYNQVDELNSGKLDGLVIPKVEPPNPLTKFVTDVFVREGSVYVLDGINDSSLLTQGESLRVNFKKTAAASGKVPEASPAEVSPAPTITTGGDQSVESTSKPFIGWAKPIAPVITDRMAGGGRYGVLKNPGSNVFVRAQNSEVWKSAEDGMIILPGDEVKTADDASVKVSLDNGKVGLVEIKGGSLFRINKAETDPGTGDKTTLLDLAIGKVLVKAGKLQGASKFEVRTPTALTGVRGTVFEVTVKEKV